VPGPDPWTIEDLRTHLMGAVELELLTIPPYLCALYSLHPGSNETASLIIRSVVVEEMLHMTLAANVLNAVGGRPDVTGGGYVPRYPAAIPYHDPPTFEVGLLPYGDAALETFLAIENPSYPVGATLEASPDAAISRALELARAYGYRTIGEFYAAIEDGLRQLNGKLGHDGLFTGKASRQIWPGHYYASGGTLTVVTDLPTALQALREIVEQGEGDVTFPPAGEKFDPSGDLAHYYRFDELRLRRRYTVDDFPGIPTGPVIEVDMDAVYPMKPNLRVQDLPPGSLRDKAVACNGIYAVLLEQIQTAFDGHPEALTRAVGTMFDLKNASIDLLRVPLPGEEELHAGPTFQYGDSADRA
jgi:hypothetical protein